MKILDRYIILTIVKASSVALLILGILLLFLAFVDEMDDVGKGFYQTSDAFLVALLSAPRIIYEIFPIAAHLGTLVGLGMLGTHGEFVAMRSSGYALRDILLATIKASVLMIAGILILGELLAPVSEQYGQTLRNTKQQKQVTMQSQNGFWARDGQAFINIRKILP